ncbi:hypothetical protein DENSPDRAFT_183157 [Dentipellis sp. KUC8613]|nr:hypothetical protein DENSPDRAFT_183157 [Dentipellis sp. KUC8613]
MVFNPKILDASIRDVVAFLSNEQKADVLLCALQHLPSGPGHRMLIENAAQSCLQIASAQPEKAIQTHLLRAKTRFAAGLRSAAYQDVQAILQIDPHHEEAQRLMPQASAHALNRPVEPSARPQGKPRFSAEIWREIASYLPRRDLRRCLFVPNALSTIASQLLFRNLHLQFGTSSYTTERTECEEADEWHARRNADILTFLLSDSTHALAVRELTISAPADEESDCHLTPFIMRVLDHTLTKLSNLRSVHCEMPGGVMTTYLEMLEKSHPTLSTLHLKCTCDSPSRFPKFARLARFSYRGIAETDLHAFLDSQKQTLRGVSVQDTGGPWTMPSSSVLSMTGLTSLELHNIQLDAESLSQVISHSTHIEVLQLKCCLITDSPLAPVFKADQSRLPSLREFVFEVSHTIHHAHQSDLDLFPALTHFLRNHRTISVLRLLVPLEHARHYGYNAALWGVLPTLDRLRSLSIPLPKDLAPALSSWLVPRSVTALDLTSLPDLSDEFATQLLPGLPPNLNFLSLSEEPSIAFVQNLATTIPSLTVLGTPEQYQSILRTASGIEVKPWVYRMAKYYGDEWLRDMGCEDARLWGINPSSIR